MARVKDFYDYLNSIAPFETQEDWDNSGMLVGDMNAEVKKVAVVLDITPEEIEKNSPRSTSSNKTKSLRSTSLF